MYQNVFRISVMLIAIGLLACTSKKPADAEEHQEVSGETWREMDDFHMIMAESFHPFKDSSNLEPAIKNAEAITEAANRWANASLPEKLDNADIEDKLGQLRSAAAAFNDLVKTGNREEIGNSLTDLHNLFHELQEEWYGAASDHEENH